MLDELITTVWRSFSCSTGHRTALVACSLARVEIMAVSLAFYCQMPGEMGFVVKSNLKQGSREHHRYIGLGWRYARSWNACILAASLVGLRPETPPGILADALYELGGHDRLARELRWQFGVALSQAQLDAMPHPVPPMPSGRPAGARLGYRM